MIIIPNATHSVTYKACACVCVCACVRECVRACVCVCIHGASCSHSHNYQYLEPVHVSNRILIDKLGIAWCSW